MTTPTDCSSCGHVLGVGRFCTNCGRPVPGRHPEATSADAARAGQTVVAPAGPPPATPPVGPPPPVPHTSGPSVTPPPVGALPPAARYPLFADEDDAPRRPVHAEPPTTVRVSDPLLPPVLPAPPAQAPPPQRTRLVWWPWAAALVALALVAGLGATLLLGDDDEAARDDAAASSSADPRDEGASRDSDDDAAGEEPAQEPDASDLVDVTGSVTATVPAVGPPSADLTGRPVTFVAANMWDGKPSTAWRMPGDGTGEEIVFELAADTVLTEVGLVNGYAKTDRGTDWYRGNRRIQQVEWEFDDGSVLTQDLADQRSIQTLQVDPVRTRTVILRLVAVSKPGKGPSRRDNTAISEVRFVGAP